MPSDEKSNGALEALAGPRDRFDETLTLSIEEIQGFLSTHRDPEEDRTDRVAHELGAFATDRIDVDRFAALLQDTQSLDREVRHGLDVALETLTRLRARGDALFIARVAPGGDLRDTVARALSEVGRAFAAARLVDAVQSGRETDDHDASQKGFPFRRWSRDERSVAPPLVVQVHGEDLTVGGLAEFLDGSVKVVLVVEGKAPPAALSQLIARGLWVEQTHDTETLGDFAAGPLPGIAAIMPGDGARFRFQGEFDEGFTVDSMPEVEPKTRIGPVSVAQQVRNLAHLRMLDEAVAGKEFAGAGDEVQDPEGDGLPVPSDTAVASPAPTPIAPADDPAGALAGWLLQNADLSGN